MKSPAIALIFTTLTFITEGSSAAYDQQPGGIGVAVADKPGGPFKDYLGKPLLDKFHNGAQPIDQFVFKDKDGQYYMIYGGWAALHYR